MNAKQRRALADRLIAIATHAGAAASRVDLTRSIDLRFVFPTGAECVIWLRDSPGCHHWSTRNRYFDPLPFNSVNDYHRGKATGYGQGVESFVHDFEGACLAVKTGWAFDDQWQPKVRA